MKYLVVIGLIAGCASVSPPPAQVPATATPTQETQPTAPPRFIVVSRNTPLLLSPDDDTPALLFRTDEEQVERDAEIAKKMAKYVEDRQKKYAKEIKAEKKRMRKIKDREKRSDYASRRRLSRARRHLKGLEKKVLRYSDGHPAERYFSLAVTGETDAFYQVQNLIEDEELPHCYRHGLAGIGRGKLTFWVRKTDAELVTTLRENVEIWRGSSVAIAAGVVVEKDEKSQTLLVDGYQIQGDSNTLSLDQTYTPGGTFEAPFTDTSFTDIAFAEGLLAFSQGQTLAFNPWVDVYVTRTLWVGKRFYATTQTHCAEFTVHAQEDLLAPVGRRAAMRLSGADAPVLPPYVAKGTPLSTLDGKDFGVATGDLALGQPLEIRTDRTCFQKWVWPVEKGANQRQITWCVSTDAVINR
jgi:hypothetical protein